tara:strand:+ start:240 stop:707 length:468 start_codon:yes stop_codon:yes gene_type:complete
MKLGKRKWARTGTERGGFDENVLKLGGPGGGAAKRTSKKAKTNVTKTTKADSTASGMEDLGKKATTKAKKKKPVKLSKKDREWAEKWSKDHSVDLGYGTIKGRPGLLKTQKKIRDIEKDIKKREARKPAEQATKDEIKNLYGGWLPRAEHPYTVK